MKKHALFFILVGSVAFSRMAFAATQTVNGITWTYTVSNGKASLGYGSSSSPAVSTSTTGAIVIPSTLGGYPVTRIDDYAFDTCRGLTSITIPDGVTTIGNLAFYDCSGLTSITIPDGVTSIGQSAFSGCSGLTTITIPDGVTSIGYRAFSDCSGLTSITIPASVTSIGAGAFGGCSGLMAIEVDSDNPNYSSRHGLLLSKDGNQVIQGVNGTVSIPSGVTSIGNYAFSGCSGLTSITISDSVTSIGDEAFSGCSGLMAFEVDSDNPNYSSRHGLLLSKDGNQVIQGVNGTVSIPPGVTSIEDYAFVYRSGLTSLTIPNSVTNIGFAAFRGCSKLTSITILDAVTSIGNYAFDDCSGLTSIVIPDSITKIGEGAFSGCTSLVEMTLPFIGSRRGTSGSLDSLFGYIFGTVSYIGGSQTVQSYGSGWSDYTKYCIPDSLRRVIITDESIVGYGAFDDCSRLTSITIPDGVTSIGKYAFNTCRGLTSITIPNSVTRIESSAFIRCSGLTSVTIPDSVTTIESGAFSYCSGLTSITIPDSVTRIESGAFQGCSGLVEMTLPFIGFSRWSSYEAYPLFGYIFGTDPYTGGSLTQQYYDSSSTSYAVYYIPTSLRRVVITDGSIVGYGAFSGCSGLASITIPDGVTTIGQKAFYNCSGLVQPVYNESGTTIWYVPSTITGAFVIPDGVTNIGERAFSSCSGLASITVPDSVTSIGDYAFKGCSGLASVAIGNGVTIIGNSAFYNCSGLTSITIPDGVTSIGNSAFSGCSGLASISIPNGVTNIENSAFSGCSGLTSVTIPNGVTNIGKRAFSSCSGLASITVPDSVTSIGDYAFEGCSNLATLILPFCFNDNTDNLSIPSTCSVRFHGFCNLTIHSEHGNPSPEIGTTNIEVYTPTQVTCSVNENDPSGGDVRYRCSGWMGTGSAPASGTGTNVTFAIMEDSTLTWNWRKENRIAVFVVGCGTCDFGTQWVEEGTPATATIVPTTHLYTIVLSGETNGVTLAGTTLVIPSDGPREIVVTVTEVKLSLDISSIRGEGDPAPGRSLWSWGDVVTASMSSEEVVGDWRYACSGWRGTGSVPTSGTKTNISFTIKMNSSLTWKWSTNVWTECTVTGDAAATPMARWSPWNGSTTVSYLIGSSFYGYALVGNAEGVVVNRSYKRITIPTDAPHRFEARFVSVETAVGTGGKPLSWNAGTAKWWPAFVESAPGGSCLRSDETEENQTSSVSATVSGAGTLSFAWKISAGRGDFCRFYVDGVETNSIQRSTGWKTTEVRLGSGTHELKWIYERGSGDATGEDAAFLDDIDWRPDVKLWVYSDFGIANPTEGSHVLRYGDELFANVTEPEPADGVRHVCTGWAGTGSVPASGTTASVSFPIRNDSSLVWNWRTDYRIALAEEGPVSADFSEDWLAAGSTQTVHWTTTAPYFAAEVSGDTNGVVLDTEARTLAIPADGTRAVTLSVRRLTLADALDSPDGLRWTTSGPSLWFPQIGTSDDGEDAAQSGTVTNGNDTCVLATAVDGPGTFSWTWRLDSAAGGNAGVDVWLDGEWLGDYAPGAEWSRETLDVSGEGTHEIRFEFWNAGTAATHGDHAFLDRVSWTGAAIPSGTVTVGGTDVPVSWLDENATDFITAAGGDAARAAEAQAANGVNKVWQCYVAGISPTNAAARFEARIEIENGVPVVKWSPDLNEGGMRNERVYTVEGQERLGEGWGPTNAASRFFRVKVAMPQAGR